MIFIFYDIIKIEKIIFFKVILWEAYVIITQNNTGKFFWKGNLKTFMGLLFSLI